MGAPKATCSQSSTTFVSTFCTALQALDARPIRGEYKLWIYQHYLAPSTHFYLAVNSTSANAIIKAEASATKALKRWLKLPRNATPATLYHPGVLGVPQLTDLKVKAKLSFLVAIDQSTDRLIQDLKPLLSVPNIIQGLHIPPKCNSILNNAKESVATLAGIKKHCKEQVKETATQHWNNHLSQLQVQRKFRTLSPYTKRKQNLEEDHEQWTYLWAALLPAQSWLRHSPHPNEPPEDENSVDSRCPLCKAPRPATAHILNGCPIALNQGRYTWRHDSVLSHIVHSLSHLLPPTYKLFADLSGWRAVDNPPATIPPSILYSPLRPDLVIIDNHDSIRILELTVPSNTPDGLKNARDRKQNKQEYGSLLTDIEVKGWNVTYDTIEIGSL